jgi:mRNA-degrading endonuclease toxin of MazEF toxin-antitoxin module
MATSLQIGQIVWAELADANGDRKVRPAVVVTPTDRITPSGPLDVVAITSRLSQPLPDDHVLLPWDPRGHPRTGLNRKCAAVCSWVSRIAVGDIQSQAGLVPASVLVVILAKLAALPPPPPAAAPGPAAPPDGNSP